MKRQLYECYNRLMIPILMTSEALLLTSIGKYRRESYVLCLSYQLMLYTRRLADQVDKLTDA